MPLGIQQNNDFTQFTMDVWNDKIFYQEKEFPAGFMAMSILNIPEEKLPELIQAGGAPTFLFPVVVQGSDEEAAAVFPQLRERILYLTELLWKYPPFCYNDYEKEMRRINILFDESALPKIRTPDSEFQTESSMEKRNSGWMGSRAEVNLAKKCPEVTLTNIAAVLDSHPTATYNWSWAWLPERPLKKSLRKHIPTEPKPYRWPHSLTWLLCNARRSAEGPMCFTICWLAWTLTLRR